jgi:hypothetical protein
MRKWARNVDRSKLGKTMLIQALIGLALVYALKLLVAWAS